MSRLYVDDKDRGIIVDDAELQQEQETKENFDKAVNDAIENRYKGEDSEAVYNLFNPAQRELLDHYFRGFSVELYKDLNGTVELQIQKRNEKIKSKINKLTQDLGVKKFNLDDWVYDGMQDAGKNAGLKCDLCPRPVRYAHFAANKKTHEVLRFGCNCAADFFNIDKSSLSSMRTIQAKTLKDIKIIAVVMENNWINEYYNYMAGYTGKTFLEQGIEGLRDLTTFVVKWDGNNLVGDKTKDLYPIKFGDGTVTQKPLNWIKANIVSCLNADLDPNVYVDIDGRQVVKISTKDMDKAQLNTAGYVKYAIKFVEVGLPIPKSLCDRLNAIINKVTRQHHPDYLKYAQDLLISHNLAKSNLLKTAFTDFIISYLSEKIGGQERDRELKYWNIRGEKTFYNEVLTWETAITKLMIIKEINSLVNKGLISEDELNEITNIRYSYSYDKIRKYIKDCIALFLSSKNVVKAPENLDAGFSKYMLEGVDKKIGVDLNKDTNGYKSKREVSSKFTADVIPFNIALHYATVQNGFKDLVSNSLLPLSRFLQGISYLDTDEEIAEYLSSLSPYDSNVVHEIMKRKSYEFVKIDKKKIVEFMKESGDNSVLTSEILKKYKGNLQQFKTDCKELNIIVEELLRNIKSYNGTKKPADIFDDYEDLVVKEEKTNKEYFIDYCDMLIAKRGNKRMQPYLKQKNLYDLVAFKAMEPYADMLKDIMVSYNSSKQKAEEAKLYTYLHLYNLKDNLKTYLSVEDMDSFITLMLYLLCEEKGLYKTNDTGISSRAIIDFTNMNEPLKNTSLLENMKKDIPDTLYNLCIDKYSNIFEELYNALKDLFIHLKKDTITFAEHYNLLHVPDGVNSLAKEFNFEKNGYNKFISTYSYMQDVNKTHSTDDFQCEIMYNIDWFRKNTALNKLRCYKGIKEAKDKLDELITPFITAEVEKAKIKLEQNIIIKPLVETVTRYLDEHIKFFEINVEEERNKNPENLKKNSDNGVKRRLAFNTVKYENTSEEITKFIKELDIFGEDNWSNGVSEVVTICKKDRYLLSRSELKKYNLALRTENYNHNLIYNHFDLTYKLLKELKAADLSELSANDLRKLRDILQVYNLMKSNMETIWQIMKDNDLTSIDFETEHNNLPAPEYIDIEEQLKSSEGPKDADGLSGVDKANLAYKHADFDNLDNWLKEIIKSVRKYKSCSPRQLNCVNQACVTLGIIQADNNTTDSNTETETQKLAKKIMAHPDFSTLPSINQGVTKTLSTSTNPPSRAQEYRLNEAKKLLGITD